MSYILLLIVLWFSLLIPIMPKIMIQDGVYMYAFDIMMVLVFIPFVFFCSRAFCFLTSSKLLTMFWMVILFSTLLWGSGGIPATGVAKIIKGIIYVPLIYVAFNYSGDVLKKIVLISIAAQLLNLFFYVQGLLKYGFSIWKANLLSSGFSNHYISLIDFSFETIPEQGAHGIWGSYCLLCLAVAIYLYNEKRLGTMAFIAIFCLTLINVCSTVSREAFLLLIVMLFSYFIFSGFKAFLKGMLLIVCIILLSWGILYYLDVDFSSVPIFAKLSYTASSIESSGSESNISLRIGAWVIILYTFFSNPLYLVSGIGYNLELLRKVMLEGAVDIGIMTYVPLPESLIMFSLAFGGIFALILMVLFIFNAFKVFSFTRKTRILSCFLLGLCLSNILSGASLISDLLYSQFLLVLGAIIRDNFNHKRSKLHQPSLEVKTI